MSRLVTLPLWLAALLAAFAAWSVLDRLLVPGVRWYFRRRVHQLLDEINPRLAIRLQPFKLTKRQVLIDRLRFDPQVLEMAERFAQEEGVPRQVVQGRVERYAREIVPSFNAYAYFRFGYWVAKRVAQSLYRVRLGVTDEAALEAVEPDATVVFLMNHRSNMDYILVSYLVMERAALSYAVGEWAKIWPLESLIRSMGAYFVRRGSGNPLYRKVLERYIHMATEAGVTQAVYPEGGLSRDGALRPPKLGVLDYMVRGFDPESQRDLVFVPVGINYDRTLEDRTLLLEAPGEEESRVRRRPLPTTLAFIGRNLALMSRSQWRRFGYACVNLGKPLSLKQYLRERDVRPTDVSREERFELVRELGEELMGRVGQVIPVVPVALVASVLASAPERAFSELELKAEALRWMERLMATGCHVYLPRRDQDYTLAVGLRMLTLRHLVREEDGLFRAEPSELSVLRYYANSIAHLDPQAHGREPESPAASS